MTIKHGESLPRTRTYTIWKAMRQRCRNPNHDAYHRYGGRGISVCQRWDDYSLFLSDMGKAPIGLTLDRRNNDGNYEKSNCQWITRLEQSKNCSPSKKDGVKAKITEYLGRNVAISDLEKSLGLARGAFHKRLERGWSIEAILTTGNRNNHAES